MVQNVGVTTEILSKLLIILFFLFTSQNINTMTYLYKNWKMIKLKGNKRYLPGKTNSLRRVPRGI